MQKRDRACSLCLPKASTKSHLLGRRVARNRRCLASMAPVCVRERERSAGDRPSAVGELIGPSRRTRAPNPQPPPAVAHWSAARAGRLFDGGPRRATRGLFQPDATAAACCARPTPRGRRPAPRVFRGGKPGRGELAGAREPSRAGARSGQSRRGIARVPTRFRWEHGGNWPLIRVEYCLALG